MVYWIIKLPMIVIICIAFTYLADTFIQSNLLCIQAIHIFISICVPWELNPQSFALLTQYSTTEPQEHKHISLVTLLIFRFFFLLVLTLILAYVLVILSHT